MVQTNLKNFGRAVLQGVVVFIATYGGSLLTTIPVSIGQVSVMSVLTFIVSWCQHSVVTPAGSSIVK